MDSIKQNKTKAIVFSLLGLISFALGITNTCVGCSNIRNNSASGSDNQPKMTSSSSADVSATTAYSTTRELTSSVSTTGSQVTSTTQTSTNQPEGSDYPDSSGSSMDNSYSDIYFSGEEDYWDYDTYDQYTEESTYYITDAFNMILQPLTVAYEMFGYSCESQILDTEVDVLIYDDYDLLVWYNSDNLITGLRLTPNNSYLNYAYGQEYTSCMTMNEINELMGDDVVDIDNNGNYYIQLYATNASGYEINLYYLFFDEDPNASCGFVEICLCK